MDYIQHREFRGSNTFYWSNTWSILITNVSFLQQKAIYSQCKLQPSLVILLRKTGIWLFKRACITLTTTVACSPWQRVPWKTVLPRARTSTTGESRTTLFCMSSATDYLQKKTVKCFSASFSFRQAGSEYFTSIAMTRLKFIFYKDVTITVQTIIHFISQSMFVRGYLCVHVYLYLVNVKHCALK